MSSTADLPEELEALLEAVERAASKGESGPITYDTAARMGALRELDLPVLATYLPIVVDEDRGVVDIAIHSLGEAEANAGA